MPGPIGINNVVQEHPERALSRRLADEARAAREQAAAPTLEAATIGQGTFEVAGGSLVIDGGDVIFKDTTGTILFRVGTQQYGDRGITFYRADGSAAIKLSKVFSSSDTVQRLQLLDESGQVIGGDAVLSPTGFDAPHLPVMWRPADRSDAKSTTSATFVTLFEHRGIRGNPGLPIQFSVLCSDATTAGEVQVINVATGLGLAPFFAAPWVGSIVAGTTTATILAAPPLALPGSANDAYTLQVQARRTAGTGTVSIAIAGSVGGSL